MNLCGTTKEARRSEVEGDEYTVASPDDWLTGSRDSKTKRRGKVHT